MSVLTVYPTSLALRQFQARQAAASGFCDSRGHVSIRMLMDACARRAREKGFLVGDDDRPLQPVTDLERDLAVVEAASRFKSDVKEGSELWGLSETAIEDVLSRLIGYVDPLAGLAPMFLDILAVDKAGKNAELAKLYNTYDKALQELGYATTARVNAAIMRILGEEPGEWPDIFLDGERVRFVGLRWVPPFVEMVARQVAEMLGKDRVELVHVLEEPEQQWWGEKLMAQAGTLVFGGEAAREEWSEYNADETTASIETMFSKVGELRDALAMLDSNLAKDVRPRLGFSRSVGVYGEVEDLARRICRLLEAGDCPPSSIAFCARNLGDYSDAVTDVFARFNIPYYFRRGVPVMSVAIVKDMLNMVKLSATGKRDAFCSLLESPWLDWRPVLRKDDRWIIHPRRLADAIRRSGVEPEIGDPAVLQHRLARWLRGKPEVCTQQAAASVEALKLASGESKAGSLKDAIGDLQKRCEMLGMEKRLQAWAARIGDGKRDKASYLLNARGFNAVMRVLEELGRVAEHAWHDAGGWHGASSVLTRCISNLTVADPRSTSAGVWVLTPYDMAGLEFDVVMCAGLNSGMFPAIPSQSAIFSDADLDGFREKLGGEFLPAAALAGSRARISQENLLFLSLMAAARERMVFSRASRDENGEEQSASVFYTTLWRLAGWASYGKGEPEAPPDPYDRWRLGTAPEVFGEYWLEQKDLVPHKRQPFHGESFLASVPLALCRAADEARQRAVLAPPEEAECVGEEQDIALTVSRSIGMEGDRGKFFDMLAEEDEDVTPERPDVVGEIGADLARVLVPDIAGKTPLEFGTTALQDLANCPYKYYLKAVLGLDPLETNEMEAAAVDFGSAIHFAMEVGFLLLSGHEKRAKSKLPQVEGLLADGIMDGLPKPAYIIKQGGTWRYLGRPAKLPGGATAVAVLKPALRDEYFAFFDKICTCLQELAASGEKTWMLGAPEQVEIQWEQIRAGCCSLIEGQLGLTDEDYLRMVDAGEEGAFIRCTAFLEHVFDSRENPRYEPDAPSVEYEDPGGSGTRIRIHGVIDRLDLLFDSKGEHDLKALMVLDYKGTSKNKTGQKLAEDVVAGHDCQLPVYGTAARSAFIGEDGEAVPVICQYLVYRLDGAASTKAMRTKWLELEGRTVKTHGPYSIKKDDLKDVLGDAKLLDLFCARVFECLQLLANGVFTVRPSTCDWCDFKGVCRFAKPALDKDDSRD